VAASFGAPAGAFEQAFERGCNYFYWGSSRQQGIREAINNICGQGKRDDLVIVIQTLLPVFLNMCTFVYLPLYQLYALPIH